MPEPEPQRDGRAAAKLRFLQAAGWGGASVGFLAGDASDRSYDRISLAQQSAVLMDAPPSPAAREELDAFLRVADWLAQAGLSAPRILAQDRAEGFLLLEDLGDGLFARLCQADPGLEVPLYTAAAEVLGQIARTAPLPGLPDLCAGDWAEAAGFAIDWYAFAVTGQRSARDDFTQCLTEALATHADGPRIVILRDFHAENLLWLPGRQGMQRVGLLDFQLAQMGQGGYDLVSLLDDARRDVTASGREAASRAYAEATGARLETLQDRLDVLAAQRALRILGVFARLCLVQGKAGYLPLIPRVWAQLQRALARPALARLAPICARLLPPPSAQTLERIARQCAHFR